MDPKFFLCSRLPVVQTLGLRVRNVYLTVSPLASVLCGISRARVFTRGNMGGDEEYIQEVGLPDPDNSC